MLSQQKGGEMKQTNEQKWTEWGEIFESDRCVQCLDYGDGIMSVYLGPNSLKCIYYICAIVCVHYT